MKLAIGLLLTLSTIALTNTLAVQTVPSNTQNKSQECPTVLVSCPSTNDGPIVFQVSVHGGTPNVKPIYTWSISAGTIVSGQGTSVLTVDMSSGGGQSLTASVTIGGFSSSCASTASCSLIPEELPLPRKFDEYKPDSTTSKKASEKFGEYNPTSLKAKKVLDEFANEIKKKEDTVAHILAYGGSSRNKNEAQLAGERARNYLIGTGIWQGRIEIIDGGFRDEATVELWVTPPGATAPKPDPTSAQNKNKQKP